MACHLSRPLPSPSFEWNPMSSNKMSESTYKQRHTHHLFLLLVKEGERQSFFLFFLLELPATFKNSIKILSIVAFLKEVSAKCLSSQLHLVKIMQYGIILDIFQSPYPYMIHQSLSSYFCRPCATQLHQGNATRSPVAT